MSQRFYIETLGCPKNDVDSDKLVGALLADGMEPTDDAALADLVVVNTCAFIDDARSPVSVRPSTSRRPSVTAPRCPTQRHRTAN